MSDKSQTMWICKICGPKPALTVDGLLSPGILYIKKKHLEEMLLPEVGWSSWLLNTTKVEET